MPGQATRVHQMAGEVSRDLLCRLEPRRRLPVGVTQPDVILAFACALTLKCLNTLSSLSIRISYDKYVFKHLLISAVDVIPTCWRVLMAMKDRQETGRPTPPGTTSNSRVEVSITCRCLNSGRSHPPRGLVT